MQMSNNTNSTETSSDLIDVSVNAPSLLTSVLVQDVEQTCWVQGYWDGPQ